MKFIFAFVLLSCTLQVSLAAIKCHVCTLTDGNQYPPNFDCGADSTNLSPNLTPCGVDQDLCIYKRIKKANGVLNYERACAKKSDYNGQSNKCNSYSVWGASHTECVCQIDGCNSSSALQMSMVALAASALFRYLF